MSFRGIDFRETGDRLIFRAFLTDAVGDKLTTGSALLRLFELQNDGTYKQFDWNDNSFKTPGTALTTPTAAMTHRTTDNNTFNLGIWTSVLATLTGFTAGNIYVAQVYHSSGMPPWQSREFQFGSGVLADIQEIRNNSDAADLLKYTSLAASYGTVATNAGNSQTSFKIAGDLLTGAGTDYFGSGDGGAVLAFLKGTTNAGQALRVIAFNSSTAVVTVEGSGFASTPSDGDGFVVLGRITELT